MTHTYSISGMTCAGCQAKIKYLLEKVPHVREVMVDLEEGTASITMDQHIPVATFRDAIKEYPKYQIKEKDQAAMPSDMNVQEEDDTRTWWQTYRPILLVFGYITSITLLIEAYKGTFSWMNWMNNFMAGFFLVFSFFKMLDLKGFSESYYSYDLLAKRWMNWGYVYAFIELGLGIAYLLRFSPFITNIVTFSVMTLSIIGVLQSVLNKRKIKCACLGAVFNLPMSTVTIIEDGLMIAMSAYMLINML